MAGSERPVPEETSDGRFYFPPGPGWTSGGGAVPAPGPVPVGWSDWSG